MTVTHMSRRDSAVTHATVTHMSHVSHVPRCHVPREAVPPTRPDPTRPTSVVGVACGGHDFSCIASKACLGRGTCNAKSDSR